MTSGARVVLLGWGNALPSQLAAYARLHRTLGQDATPATSLVANTMAGLARASAYPRAVEPLVRDLVGDPDRPTIVHVFSDNGFITWAALLEQLARTAEGRRVRDAIRGVIVDSAPGLWNVTGPSDFARRFALAMTPALARRMKLGAREEVPLLTPVLGGAFLTYQLLFPGPVERMIQSGARVAREQPRCPHLFVYGEDDTVVPPHDVRAWVTAQRERGIEVDDQPFPAARHVALFPKDPRRYKALVKDFLARVLVTVAMLLLVVGFALVSGGCKKKLAPESLREPAAAAGTEVDDEDAGDALVEDAHRYPVRSWTFPMDRFELRAVDLGMSTALDHALDDRGGELAVNGGFFDPQGKPVGLVVSDGTQLSGLATATSGGVLTWDGERLALHETETFHPPEHLRFAVQCRPRLVVGGSPNVKRDDGQRSERTALCVRDGGKTLEVVVVKPDTGAMTGPSLFALGRYLAKHGCEDALNLDGGPSTGVAWREDGGTMQLAPRKPVRHAVVIAPRKP